jgi:hypothetical protein
MKTRSFLIAGAALLIALPALHAQITWAAAPTNWSGNGPTDTGSTDISTLGTFVAAADANGNVENTGVGNTIFESSAVAGVSISGVSGGGGDGSGSNATPYLEALNGCNYVNVIPNSSPDGVSDVATVTLNGLTDGDTYQVQVWSVVGYSGPDNANQRETELSGTSPAYLVGSDFILGKFTAGASDMESFTFQGLPGGDYGEIEAVALRDITATPEPSTYAMLCAGVGALVLVARLRRVA